jgi:hypothetical protein
MASVGSRLAHKKAAGSQRLYIQKQLVFRGKNKPEFIYIGAQEVGLASLSKS